MTSEVENLRQRISELESENAALRESSNLAALPESEERLSTIIENMPMMLIAVDPNRRITMWNRECERITGYSAAEMLGRDDFMEVLYPDQVYRASLMAESQKRSGEYRGWEMELTCKDGAQRTISWFNVSKHFPVKGWDRWTLGVDVTPRVQAEREIRRLNGELEQRVVQRTAEFEDVNRALQDQIIESIQTQELVQQYADEITDLYNNAPCGYHSLDANGIFIRMNDTELTMLGYTRDEVIGRMHMVDIIPPEDREKFGGGFTELREKGMVHDIEGVFVLKNGDRMPILLNSTVALDAEGAFSHTRSTVFDMTERKKTDALVQEYADELADLYNNSPCGYYSLDKDGTFIRINDSQLQMLGYTRDEMLGKMKIFDLYAPELQDLAHQRFEMLRTKGMVRGIEATVLRKDGTSLPVLINSSVVYDDQGEFLRTRSTMLDVSELWKAQNTITELNQHLEARAAMLESANQELEAFSYSVSHDLRAPLRAIDGFSRAVMETYGAELPEQGQHYLKRVRQNARRMGQLIDDLLDFSRISRRPVNKTLVSPVHIARQVIRDAKEQNPDVENEIVVNDMPLIEADGGLLQQVYANLIENAIKFTRLKPNPRIEIGCNQFTDELIYFVKDNGVGFDMAYVDKIFGVFQRLHSQVEYEGTGVGLATVQRIINRHGGKIWVEAQLNEGATFYFTLKG